MRGFNSTGQLDTTVGDDGRHESPRGSKRLCRIIAHFRRDYQAESGAGWQARRTFVWSSIVRVLQVSLRDDQLTRICRVPTVEYALMPRADTYRGSGLAARTGAAAAAAVGAGGRICCYRGGRTRAAGD